jgi:hypothetical protein
MDWNDEVQKEYDDVVRQFGLKYANRAIEDFNALCQSPPDIIDRTYIQKLKAVDYSKLKPFVNKGIEQFDKAYKALDETKTQNLNLYRRKFFETKVEEFQKQVTELAKQSISQDRKKYLQNDFDKLRDEFIDFMDLQMTIGKDVSNMIENLRVSNFSNQQHRKRK